MVAVSGNGKADVVCCNYHSSPQSQIASELLLRAPTAWRVDGFNVAGRVFLIYINPIALLAFTPKITTDPGTRLYLPPISTT